MKKVQSESEELYEFLCDEYKHPFQGWDFSHITRTGRMCESPLKWSYGSIVLEKLRKANSMLDLGTGGGELLMSFRPLPARTSATESYKPNVSIAKNRLEPLGVEVFETQDDRQLPFERAEFDLVINRHESYSATEIFRILRPAGCFITQQVGDRNDNDLRRLLGSSASEPRHWNLEVAVNQMRRAGFRVALRKQDFPQTRFYDVGALVYYLRAVPWVIPDFSVRKYFSALVKVKLKIEAEGYLNVRNHRFLVMASRP